MNRDEIYQKMLDIAIKNGVELTENAYKIASARCMCNIDLDKCICSPKDSERYCISEKCMQDIKENGICHCRCYRKVCGK